MGIAPMNLRRSSYFDNIFERRINTRPKMRNIFEDEFFNNDPFFNSNFDRNFDALDLFENRNLRPMKLCKNTNKRRNGLFELENNLFKDFDQLLSLEDMQKSKNLENCSKNKNSTGFSLSKRSVTINGESEIFKNGDIQSEFMELTNGKNNGLNIEKTEILPIESEIYEEKQEEDKKSHPESDDVIIEEI